MLIAKNVKAQKSASSFSLILHTKYIVTMIREHDTVKAENVKN
jgi:hypothetical protein